MDGQRRQNASRFSQRARMSPDAVISLVRCRGLERRFGDLVGSRQSDGRRAPDVAPQRELHGPATDLRDEPTEDQLRAEANRMRGTKPNGDLAPHSLGAHDLSTDAPANRFAVHRMRI
jgi:hypothetical protein